MVDQWRLPPDLEERVRRELYDGEILLWAGQPVPMSNLMRAIPVALFGLPFAGFAVFWIWAASGGLGSSAGAGAGFFPLFGVPFVLVGLGMLLSPVFALRAAKRTIYAVTDQRAIVIEGGLRRTVRSFGPDKLSSMERRERFFGCADLIFDREISHHHSSKGGTHTRVRHLGFLGIENAREVERLVRDVAVVTSS